MTDFIPKELLPEIAKSGTQYSHEAKAMAVELMALHAGDASADADRWKWFRLHFGCLDMDFETDGNGVKRIVRVEPHSRFIQERIVPESLDSAVDAAIFAGRNCKP